MQGVRKLILRCGLAAGDIVMLTAAVRDLHFWHPGEFLTDVRTSCLELWENNPHLTPLSEGDPSVEVIECSYPLIDASNGRPYHCLHGFMAFLNQRLGLRISPTVFRGDIHLATQEKAWYSQVQEVTGESTPFWVVAAGGKYDVPIKWWSTERYQAVVDHFRGRIQFVQVGDWGHHHPRLEGVIDLRGRTTLRELVRLVYHAQGVLAPVTALMHLAAAVPLKDPHQGIRPCVVVAGGREPPHWEAYPGHQFIHTVGALPCCAAGGCWKDRIHPLGDGRDRRSSRCVDVVGDLPRCMDMISAAEVIRRIELYHRGGSIRYLSARERTASERGVRATRRNRYDHQPLSLHSARLGCDSFLREIPSHVETNRGRGIVMCVGGARYFTCAYVCIRMLRRLGCRLPIQAWSLSPDELDADMQALLIELGVECVDARRVRRRHPARRLGGWELKPFAILHSPFEEVLFLDADNVPVVNPEGLFDTPEYQRNGAVFWPDYGRDPKAAPLWRCLGMRRPAEPEFESGQILVDKRRCWKALSLTVWMNEHSDFFYRHLHGDKETFHLAFRRSRTTYALVPHPIHTLPGTMCQHDFGGRRVFQHRNTDKWSLFLLNRRVRGFRFEEACRGYVLELRSRWDGGRGRLLSGCPRVNRRTKRVPVIRALIISCPEREEVRQQTLKNLAATDWDHQPLLVMLNGAAIHEKDPRIRQTRTALLALKRGLATNADYLLVLEDDLEFNRHLRHNLHHWGPLAEGRVGLASLYNPGLQEMAYDLPGRAIAVDRSHVFGSQAFLLHRGAAARVTACWNQVSGMQDIRISRLAGRLPQPILYHAPSLVQHVGHRSVWGGRFHQAQDFHPDWRA